MFGSFSILCSIKPKVGQRERVDRSRCIIQHEVASVAVEIVSFSLHQFLHTTLFFLFCLQIYQIQIWSIPSSIWCYGRFLQIRVSSRPFFLYIFLSQLTCLKCCKRSVGTWVLLSWYLTNVYILVIFLNHTIKSNPFYMFLKNNCLRFTFDAQNSLGRM